MQTYPGFYEDWPRGYWTWLRWQQNRARAGGKGHFRAYKVTEGCFLTCDICHANIWVSGPLGERYFDGPAVQRMVMDTHQWAHGVQFELRRVERERYRQLHGRNPEDEG